ncbi:UDP-N-acetylglucosamine 2-epimerase (non-hydrolyzing) [Solihabitans fulvus]|uniref:UDP-N-acetylglucosamine 2-epimerase (non-hydrolyzing) n=1 Tax=Solihabitans fulvus TaxID=1892852 RepID=A0A5B2WYJ2_9PSEU|nr:UDP-N-acetylglucosamine 2-epimerase (non-hydrolyzing) [Solihabitans fulvus]KAA2255489.1 UDP-N-acetylglucosamine 2-epimerase (non-hydrolyzing) [Solihabitans fulvus]
MVSKEILLVAGTRAEAVKIAPVAVALAGHPVLRPVIVHSGQHAGAVEQALDAFGLAPDITLDTPRPTGSQAELMASLLPAFESVLGRREPAAVLVQGDTDTTLAGALAAFWRRIPVAHLEAGLRTGDLAAPFPEEGNRQMVSRIAALHLAPTEEAAAALRAERVPEREIVVTGNTVVDAVERIADVELTARNPALAALERDLDATEGRLVLVTVHRRESWGEPLDRVLAAVRSMVDRHPDIRVLLPAHPNPSVRDQVSAALAGHPRIVVTEPLGYPDLVRVLRRAALVLTDSGGIQEEAPTFGVPVLVLRDATERMPAVEAGCAWLVGTDSNRILAEAGWVLGSWLRLPPGRNPFGDGSAAGRVCAALERLVGPSKSDTVERRGATVDELTAAS